MKAILTFHSVDDSGSVLSYSPSLFAKLLSSFERLEIPVVEIGHLLLPDTDRGVAITFDDGMRSVLSNALPILKDFNAPAHLFLTTDAITNGENWPEQPSDVPSFEMLDWDQVGKLSESGVYIDAHTASHPDMRKLTSAALLEECELANDEIQRRTGRRPEFFAYPFGYHNIRSRDVCRKLYRASVTTELRKLSEREDMAALPRLDSYYLQSKTSIERLDSLFVSAYLRTRWILRTLRGTHCTASYDDGAPVN